MFVLRYFLVLLISLFLLNTVFAGLIFGDNYYIWKGSDLNGLVCDGNNFLQSDGNNFLCGTPDVNGGGSGVSYWDLDGSDNISNNNASTNIKIVGSILDPNDKGSIDPNNRQLRDASDNVIVEWNNAYSEGAIFPNLIGDATGHTDSIDPNNRILYTDDGTTPSLNWVSRYLTGTSGETSVDWANRYLYDATASFISIDWANRQLIKDGGQANNVKVLDWLNQYLVANDGTSTRYDWQNNIIYDSSTAQSSDFSNRLLYSSNGNNYLVDWTGTVNGSAPLSFDLSGNTAFYGSLLNASDSSPAISIPNRILYASDGSTGMMTWDDSGGVSFPYSIKAEGDGTQSINTESRQLMVGASTALDWSNASAIKLNQYTSDGCLQTSNTDGTLIVGSCGDSDLNTVMGLGNWTDFDLNMNVHNIVDVNAVKLNGKSNYSIYTKADGNVVFSDGS